ncbi:hypothetical protein QRN89_10065 [Streptomyces chengbuensis]|uniref:hypothetical protein n=1 Tax=Streptomyces chengbuensis TaxID=3053466 RepID=UPI0025B3CB36|nr:hypothetical protein [Streptomyces sp. HUAS CB01]WJY50136.1 hypothetical protein QRN89_10065 [Streptomyces sp. HUAS CB01]
MIADTKRMEEGNAHLMTVERILAGECAPRRGRCCRPRGVHGALLKRSFGDTQNLRVIFLKDHAEDTLRALVSRTLDFAPSISAVRLVAQQNGLRLIRESDGDQQTTQLSEPSVQQTLDAVASEVGVLDGAELYLKVGRKVARIDV